MASILLIEDDRILSKACGEKLTTEGHQIAYAFDGESGLQEIHKNKPDVILLDILLPKRDGVSVLREIRNNPTLKNLPVIVLTNIGFDDPIAKEVRDLGAAAYMLKVDSNPDTIAKEVLKTLNK